MGWNGSGGGSTPIKPKVTAKKPSPIRGIVAGALICVLAIGAYFVFFSGSEKAQKEVVEKRPTKIKQVTPTPAPKKAVAKPVANLEEHIGKDGKPLQKIGNKWGKRLSSVTNRNGYVTEEWELENGKHLENFISPPPVFDNAADQILALIASVKPGADMPPLPAMGAEMDAAFANAVATPIKINESDSEEVKELKQRVMETRRQMAELIGEGKSFSQIVAEHQDLVQFSSTERTKAIREIQSYIAEGDEESARLYRDKINAAFESMGIDQINMAIGEQEKAERQTRKRGRQ